MTDPIDPKNAKLAGNQRENTDDDPYLKAQNMLSAFKPGMSIAIHRLRPSWCSGFLERIECFEDEPIDIEHIINQWGGKRLKLRMCDSSGQYLAGCDLNLSSYPPRFFGRVVSPDDDWLPTNKPVKVPVASSQDELQKQPDVVGLIRELRAILEPQQQSMIPAPAAQPNAMSQFLETAAALKKIQGLFGSSEPVAPQAVVESEGDSTRELFGQITTLIGALRGNQSSPPQQSKPRVVADPEKKPQQRAPLADVLSGLDAEKYSEILLTSLGRMPENKREHIIANFLSKTGLDGLLGNDGDEDDDEFDDDVENDNTENKHDPRERGSISPDEKND